LIKREDVVTTRASRRHCFVGVPLLVTLATVGALAIAQEERAPVVEAGSGDVEARLTKVERLVQSRGLLDLVNQIEALQQEVQRLKGEIEQQQHLIEELSAKQRKGLGNLDQRVQSLERGVPNAAVSTAMAPTPTEGITPEAAPPANTTVELPATPDAASSAATTPPSGRAAAEATASDNASATNAGAVSTTPPAQVAANAPATDVPENPDQAYDAAFNALKVGKYDDAIAQFNNFLVSYPDSARADSAQYWLGEAYYVNKQYDPAIMEYQKLVNAYPTSQKVSQAMLKIGFCQNELGQLEQARATLEEVKQRFPGTTSARMAEDRLQRMRLEQNP